MRPILLLAIAVAGYACGGKEVSNAAPANTPRADAGATSAAGDGASPVGVGPIDMSGLPSEVAMICEGKTQIALKLPCAVGLNLGGSPTRESIGTNVTECQLSSYPALSTSQRVARLWLL